MTVQTVFARNMRRRRTQLGLTQEQLGQRAGLHRTYIGSIEQFRANVTLQTLDRIARALGVPAAWLLVDPRPRSAPPARRR